MEIRNGEHDGRLHRLVTVGEAGGQMKLRVREWFLSLDKGGQALVAAGVVAGTATLGTGFFAATGGIIGASVSRPPAPTATVTVTATATVTATVTATATPQITIINVAPSQGPR
jgi:hypothetical protein